jgi:hypothetical protein
VDPAISSEAIEAATGHSWEAWLAYFESADAADKSHQEIVALADAFGAEPWWRQMVAIAYEQHLGRRVRGQRGDGSFAVSASKTLAGSVDDSLARWIEVVGSPKVISGVAVESGPETSSTEKWRYWRCTLADGSRVAVNISLKAPGKAVVAVQHERLESEDLGEPWRAYWRSVLKEL